MNLYISAYGFPHSALIFSLPYPYSLPSSLHLPFYTPLKLTHNIILQCFPGFSSILARNPTLRIFSQYPQVMAAEGIVRERGNEKKYGWTLGEGKGKRWKEMKKDSSTTKYIVQDGSTVHRNRVVINLKFACQCGFYFSQLTIMPV